MQSVQVTSLGTLLSSCVLPCHRQLHIPYRHLDVQVHKFSLKPQGTKGRGVWDNFGYNKRLLKLFFSDEYALSSEYAQSDHIDLLNSKTYWEKLFTKISKAICFS